MYGSEYRSILLGGVCESLYEPLVWLFVALAGLMLCQTELQRRPLKIKHTQDIHQRCPCKNRALPLRVSTYMQKTSASGSLSVRGASALDRARVRVLMGVISSALHHCMVIIWIFLTFAFEISRTVRIFFFNRDPVLCAGSLWHGVFVMGTFGPPLVPPQVLADAKIKGWFI